MSNISYMKHSTSTIQVGDYVEVYDNSGLLELTSNGMKSVILALCSIKCHRTRLQVLAIGCSLPSDTLSGLNNEYILTDGKSFYFSSYIKKWKN